MHFRNKNYEISKLETNLKECSISTIFMSGVYSNFVIWFIHFSTNKCFELVNTLIKYNLNGTDLTKLSINFSDVYKFTIQELKKSM